MEAKVKQQNLPKENLSTSIFNSFVAGAFSGVCSSVLLQPFDLIKTRVQQSPNQSLWTITKQIAKNEGLTGFWTGVTPTLWRIVPGIGIFFSCYHTLTSQISTSGKLTSAESLVVGVVSRVFAGSILIPFTVVKTRWEASGEAFKYRGHGVLSAVKNIASVEGPRGLVSGLVPTIVRDAPYAGIYLLFYNNLKQMAAVSEMTDPNKKSGMLFGCGLAAGAGATIIVQPADVVKTQLQLKQMPVSQMAVVKEVFKERGISGFFVGLVPRIVRKSLMSALAWCFYERVTDRIRKKL